MPAVLAVVVRGHQVALVRRANDPDRGKWGFPGGKVERGETLSAATERELREETGIIARTGRLLATLDVIGAAHHYILIAHRCDWVSGEPVAGDDADEARWFDIDTLPAMGEELSVHVIAILRLAMAEG